MVDDDHSRRANGANAVALAAPHDRRLAWMESMDTIREGDLELAFEDVPDLFLLVVVEVHRRPGGDRVVGERHVLRVEELPMPAGSRLQDGEARHVDERHGRHPPTPLVALRHNYLVGAADFAEAGSVTTCARGCRAVRLSDSRLAGVAGRYSNVTT